MTRKQYAVDTVRDEPVRLRDQLDHIAAEGGRVVSVIWQPARQVIFRRDGSVRPTLSLAKPLRTAQPRRQRRLGRRQHHQPRPPSLAAAHFRLRL